MTHWSGWGEFWHMGGYAFFVWTSYGIAAAVLLATWVAPVLRARAVVRRLARRERLAERDRARWSAA